MFILDQKGLKLSLLLGASLIFIGSLIKCFAVDPNLFVVAMIVQAVCAMAQTFLTVFFVSDQPKIPPNLSQLEVRSEQYNKKTENDSFCSRGHLWHW